MTRGSIPFTRSNLFNHLAALGIAGDTLPGCSGDTFAPDLFVARILRRPRKTGLVCVPDYLDIDWRIGLVERIERSIEFAILADSPSASALPAIASTVPLRRMSIRRR